MRGIDTRTLLEMASMYYLEEATQNQIAEKFGISRSLVSKSITKARDLGLVEITIHNENLRPYKSIEDEICRRFGLLDVFCVSSSDSNQLKSRMGAEAARYLMRVIKNGSIVGVSAGTTIYEVAVNTRLSIPLTGVTFVPLVGGMGKAHTDIQSNVICDILTQRFGGSMLELHVPVMVDDVESKTVFMRQRYIKDVFDTARRADIALVGIGGAPTYHEMTKAYFHKVDRLDSSAIKGVVGDICYNFISKTGQLVDTEWNHRVMAIELTDLQRIPLVIGVAGGQEKVQGIRAALNGKLINVLVTDIESAIKLLDTSLTPLSAGIGF